MTRAKYLLISVCGVCVVLAALFFVERRSDPRLSVSFIWNLHQPFYTENAAGEFEEAWVRLRTVKDYYRMIRKAEEEHTPLSFVISPSLIEQIDWYARGKKDVLQTISRVPAENLTLKEKETILRRFFEVQKSVALLPFPRYKELLEKRGARAWTATDAEIARALQTFSENDYRDIQTWFNLVWIDPELREEFGLDILIEKGSGFSEEEKNLVLDVHEEIIERTLPLMRKLAEEEKIEVVGTSIYWGILPLIIDSDIARAPDNENLPARFSFPEDARAHVEKSISYYMQTLGKAPRGFFPSEGAISDEAMEILSENGIQWTALSDLILGTRAEDDIYDVYCYEREKECVNVILRDKRASDFFLSAYTIPSDEAVRLFIDSLVSILERAPRNSSPIVTVLIDGENPWDNYMDNANELLNSLYGQIKAHPSLSLVTPSSFISKYENPRVIRDVIPSSWHNDGFRMWIGEKEENIAWEYLLRARNDFKKILENKNVSSEARADAYDAILKSESGDWFWMYGDDDYYKNTSRFDSMFRAHLKSAYSALGVPAPEYLDTSIVP